MRRRAGEPHRSGRRRSLWRPSAPAGRSPPPLRANLLVLVLVLLRARVCAQDVPAPADVLGFDPVAAGSVVDTGDIARYAHAVAASTPRATTLPFGLSTDGAPLRLVVVSSAENLSRWRELRRTGEKVFALITCGIHPDEVGSTAAFFPLLHGLARAREVPYDGLLDDLIVVLVPGMNPDGTDRVAAWLRREGRLAGALPVLYHRYCGHDLNRDWMLATQAETRAVIRRVHHVFFPWVTIDLHQMGRLGPRLFLPPYAEPMDPEVAWDIRAHVESLGDRVFEALRRAGRPGVVRRWIYDGWTPARAYPFYHGGLRVLLEAASADHAHPFEVRPSDLWISGSGNDATEDHPQPWGGGTWDLAQITDLLVETTMRTLLALRDEPLRSGQRAHFRRVLLEDDGVLLDGRDVDPGITRSLLRRLTETGARITAGDEPATWVVRDPAWGSGWSRSLLLCAPYPSPPREGRSPRPGSFNASPYDTATHDLALMAGLRAEPWEAAADAPTPRGERAAALAAHLAGEAPSATPDPSPGRMTSYPGGDDASDWLVTQRSLTTITHLPDLLEAGVRIERLTGDVRELGASAGDLLLRGAHRDWIERLVREGADAARLDRGGVARAGLAPLRYPRRLWVLEGSRPSMDEGWLRWVLETYRFRFRRIQLDELLVDRDFGRRRSPPEWGRHVLIIPEGTLLRPLPRLRPILDDLVAGGGRVVALGRASRWVARTCRLPLDDLALARAALPGNALRTRAVAPAGYEDPLLWGYRRAPDVLYDRGPLWRRAETGARAETSAVDVEDLLVIDPEQPLACGLLDSSHAEQVAGGVSLVRLRHPTSGGEWILSGFRPHFRGWTLGPFRLLFNMILAP